MRILLAVIILAAFGWSLYWVVGSRMVERGARDWFAAREAEGWIAAYDDIAVMGFPNRFDLTISGIELADPETGVAWSAPFFQIFALSYRTNHVIAVWPDQQRIATPQEKITVTSGDMRASAVMERGQARVLDRATVTFDTIGLSSTAGWSSSLASGQLSVRRSPAAATSYDIAFDARELKLPGGLAERLSQRGLVSGVAASARLEATVAFDRVWDRRAIEERRPQPRGVDLDIAQATWGELDLRVAGDVTVGEAGVPDGSITVKAQNWREILTLAQAAGMVPESAVPLIERGLETLASLNGNPSTIDVPLSIDDGRMRLGGIIPLGRAPRIVLR